MKFKAKIAKEGRRYHINIPKSLYLEIEKLLGQDLLVELNDEVSERVQYWPKPKGRAKK